jgi:hypothetical protein
MPIRVIKDDKYFGEMTSSVSRNPGTYPKCITISTAKLPGLIITSLISPHPTLTAIAF